MVLLNFTPLSAFIWTVLGLIVIILIYILVIRPWITTWGTTTEEQRKSMPGDQLMTDPQINTTHALTINAPPEKVWPWIVQVGLHRAGWYNYDLINRMMGAANYYGGHRSADKILPQFQDLKVGDEVFLAPELGMKVHSLKPNEYLVLNLGEEPVSGFVWTYYLNRLDRQKTRLVIRYRMKFPPGPMGWLMFRVSEPATFLQERAHILGIKRRAENEMR